jgi:flagellar basal-body rod modification protein FlgD
MTGANPIVTTPPPASTGTSTSGTAKSQTLNELGPNAFITLLTAQLQAQDPLSPLDPNQMVSELTSMNTLQEIIQIRQDLDNLAAASQSSSGNGGTGSPPPTGSSSAISSPTANPASTAASALSSGLAALTRSLAPSSISNLQSQANAKSQLF